LGLLGEFGLIGLARHALYGLCERNKIDLSPSDKAGIAEKTATSAKNFFLQPHYLATCHHPEEFFPTDVADFGDSSRLIGRTRESEASGRKIIAIQLTSGGWIASTTAQRRPEERKGERQC